MGSKWRGRPARISCGAGIIPAGTRRHSALAQTILASLGQAVEHRVEPDRRPRVHGPAHGQILSILRGVARNHDLERIAAALAGERERVAVDRVVVTKPLEREVVADEIPGFEVNPLLESGEAQDESRVRADFEPSRRVGSRRDDEMAEADLLAVEPDASPGLAIRPGGEAVLRRRLRRGSGAPELEEVQAGRRMPAASARNAVRNTRHIDGL